MLKAADLFCGAGGTSTGLAMACKEKSKKVDLVAVNCWQAAVDAHRRNHPWARHVCARLEADEARPRVLVPGGKLDILTASPECTHHSNARGDRPIDDQKRVSAFRVVDWITELNVDNVLVENVREFMDWGPVDSRGRKIKSRKGEVFRAWLNAIASLGYHVQHDVLNAADYGEATSRRRLFVLATRRRGGIKWPSPTHVKDPKGDLFKMAKWRAAREIIDWSIDGRSIFGRKRPLSPKTIARIAHGLKKFGGKAAEPFLVMLNGGGREGPCAAQSIDGPLPTITAGGKHHALVQPFLIKQHFDRDVYPVDDPLGTVVGRDCTYLAQPFITSVAHGDDDKRVRSIEDPLGTQTTKNDQAIVFPFMTPRHGERKGQDPRTHSVEDPAPTIPAAGGPILVEPMLMPYYSSGSGKTCHSLSNPMPTATAKCRFGLVTFNGQDYALDIRLRMLEPHELAAAMGFPPEYFFSTKKTESVRMIGNAVCVNLAKHLCKAMIA